MSNLTRGLTKNAKNYEKSKVESEDGSPGRIRTSDQPVNSPGLCEAPFPQAIIAVRLVWVLLVMPN